MCSLFGEKYLFKPELNFSRDESTTFVTVQASPAVVALYFHKEKEKQKTRERWEIVLELAGENTFVDWMV